MAINWELRKARTELGFTQAELARVSGMGTDRYLRIEHGRVAPTADEQREIAFYLGRRVKEVFASPVLTATPKKRRQKR